MSFDPYKFARDNGIDPIHNPQVSSSGFDPVKFAEDHAIAPSTLTPEETDFIKSETEKKISPVGAFSYKAGNSLVFGLPVLDYGFAGLDYANRKIHGGDTDFKHSLEYTRALGEALAKQNPKAAMAGDIVGTAGSFVSPGGLIAKGLGKALEAAPIVAKAATKFPGITKTLGGIVGQGAEGAAMAGASGAAQGYGTQEGALGGAVKGAEVGGGFGAMSGGLGGALTKGAGLMGISGFTGRDPGLVSKYYGKLNDIHAAPSLEGVADEFGGMLSKTRNDLMEGGKEVSDLLSKSQVRIKKEALRDVINSHFDEAIQKEATPSAREMITSKRDEFLKGIGEYSPDSAVVRPDEARYVLDSLRREASFDASKKTLLEKAATGAQSEISEGLKGVVPGYGELMGKQQEKIYAMNRSGLKPFRTPEGSFEYSPDSLDALMKNVAKGKRGANDVVDLVSSAAGGNPADLKNRIQASYLKTAFDTQRPNGSRNVNMFANIGETVGGAVGGERLGKAIGSSLGWASDKVAAPVAKFAMGKAKQIENKWESYSPQAQAMLRAAAARGPAELVLAHTTLLDRDPEYRKAFTGGPDVAILK